MVVVLTEKGVVEGRAMLWFWLCSESRARGFPENRKHAHVLGMEPKT